MEMRLNKTSIFHGENDPLGDEFVLFFFRLEKPEVVGFRAFLMRVDTEWEMVIIFVD